MWCSVFEQLSGLDDIRGLHVLLVDAELCAGTPLLVWAMQKGASHAACLWESPLHYQAVSRKLGKPLERVAWLDRLDLGKVKEGSFVVIDSLFPLQVAGEDVVSRLRAVRSAVGSQGTLVSLCHADCEQLNALRYEADAVVTMRAVKSSDVTGRISVSRRGAPPSEMLFTVRPDTVVFTRV